MRKDLQSPLGQPCATCSMERPIAVNRPEAFRKFAVTMLAFASLAGTAAALETQTVMGMGKLVAYAERCAIPLNAEKLAAKMATSDDPATDLINFNTARDVAAYDAEKKDDLAWAVECAALRKLAVDEGLTN